MKKTRIFDHVAYLSERWHGHRELDEFVALMQVLGNPQNKFRSIQVAGTNGKGSVCSFIANILIQDQKRVGLFTSPSLGAINERFMIDGELVQDGDLQTAALLVQKAERELQRQFGGFDRMCAVALLLFAKFEVDYAVLETGMGGRLDATNIVQSDIAVITTIAIDHAQQLGATIAKIADEKAGIIKSGQRCVVILPQQMTVMNRLLKKCQEVGVAVHRVDQCTIARTCYDELIQKFTVSYRQSATFVFETCMMGYHQLNNACAAFLVAQALNCDPIAIRNGIGGIFLPRRMEFLEGNPDVLIDGAHNPNAVEVLLGAIQDYFPTRSIILITAIMKDKDCETIIRRFSSRVRYCIAVSVSERCEDPDVLGSLAHKFGIGAHKNKSFQQAFVDALMLCDEKPEEDSLVLVAGSLYLAGEFRRFLLSEELEEGE